LLVPTAGISASAAIRRYITRELTEGDSQREASAARPARRPGAFVPDTFRQKCIGAARVVGAELHLICHDRPKSLSKIAALLGIAGVHLSPRGLAATVKPPYRTVMDSSAQGRMCGG
jgi:hypothetical protein